MKNKKLKTVVYALLYSANIATLKRKYGARLVNKAVKFIKNIQLTRALYE